MKIHRLKETVINRIAAGEVVERPASVVKELLENAVDAGADRIEIAIDGGGKNLIRVADNGSGIAADELELAVSRHCTSKMGDDIHDIRALGFRGEALPSIASVARLRLASRPKDAAAGAEITVCGGTVSAVKPAALAYGSIAEIRDLFYATPARLKFLKSERAEAMAISDIVKRTSIAFPHIRFTLSGADRLITDLAAAPAESASRENGGEAQTADSAKSRAYRARLAQILGKDFIENSVKLRAERENVRLLGFVSIPSYHRGNALCQFIYVNGRPVRDKNLTGALRGAYADMLPSGRYAVAALFLELDPALVDVNVHPAKADVRFRDAGLIRGLIVGAVRQSLEQAGARSSTASAAAFMRAAAANSTGRNTPNAAAHISAAARDVPYGTAANSRPAPSEPAAAHSFSLLRQGKNSAAAFHEDAPSLCATEAEFLQKQTETLQNGNGNAMPPVFSPSADLRSEENINSRIEQFPPQHSASAETAATADEMAENGSLFPLGAARAQIHKNYIIAQTEDSLIIVDQHAAHERLVYEALKQALYAKPLASQMLLIPEIVELSAEDIARLMAYAEDLQKFGLFFEPFGIHALAVREVPALLGEVDARRLLRDLADEIAEHETAHGLKNMLNYVAATMACHGSVRSGRLLKPQEMNALLRQMEQVPQSGTCNHGRPTFIELKLTDIEKLFARR